MSCDQTHLIVSDLSRDVIQSLLTTGLRHERVFGRDELQNPLLAAEIHPDNDFMSFKRASTVHADLTEGRQQR
jgi:hypothetical protein